jgi:hypothetical protein
VTKSNWKKKLLDILLEYDIIPVRNMTGQIIIHVNEGKISAVDSNIKQIKK